MPIKYPDISVVTATYNRKEILQMMLEHLAKQTLSAEQFEVVLVDDGSTDGTEQLVTGMRDNVPFELRFFTQEHKGPGAAHNYGVRSAKADIVLFLANDILTVPDALESHLKTHQQNPEQHIAVVGNLRESKDLPQTAFQKAWNPFDWVQMDRKDRLTELDFWISNLSMKRDFFLEKGVFLEFPEPALEDNELAYRLFKNGLKLLYCPEAVGEHYHPQTLDSALRRVYVTGKNFPVFEALVADDTTIHKFAHILSKRLDATSYCRILIRDMVRLSFFNRCTVPLLVVPLIKAAETHPFLERYVNFLTKRACGYYFRKGVSDGRKSLRNAS